MASKVSEPQFEEKFEQSKDVNMESRQHVKTERPSSRYAFANGQRIRNFEFSIQAEQHVAYKRLAPMLGSCAYLDPKLK